MNPAFLDEMSWEMAEVYGAVNDRILINLAKYFPYFKESNIPASTFAYQSAMLAQMGQVNRETVQIIRQYLGDADSALQGTLETAIVNSIEKTEPQLWQAAKRGILMPPTMPIVAPNQLRAFQLYYKQSADRLNLVNTVMLESTRNAYTAAVSDIVGQVNIQNRIDATQSALNIGAGETITGVESWNRASDHAIKRMADKGITGFVDHAGRQWSAEAYAAMDIRTTVFNVGRAAVWEQNENFGNDLYVVSYHSGARPLCYPWQLKVISSTNNARTVLDLDGEEVEVIAQDATSYGEAAGLFGVNCQHYPTPFIPGVSKVTGEVQDKETNDRIYAESQEQRRLERKLREEKRDLEMLKSRGAPDDQIAAQRARVKQSSQDINNFCEETGRARHRDREAVRTQRSFPSKDSYDVTQFEHAQQERIREYYQRGGAQQRFSFGTLVPNAPITPATPQTPTTPTTAPATAQTVSPAQQGSTLPPNMKEMIERNGATKRPFGMNDRVLTSQEIADKISGADQTRGSCASVGLAYAGNKAGYDVYDFQGGSSQYVFSRTDTLRQISQFPGIDGTVVKGYNDFTNAHTLLANVEEGHEYFFTAGKHAAIVRKTENGIEYLEMQSGYRKNTWYPLNDGELKRRFGCQKSHTTYGMKYETSEVIFDIDNVRGNSQFEEVLQYLNTAPGKQRKGIGGGEK